MVTVVRGHTKGGIVVPDEPLNVPDGLEVELQISTFEPVPSATPGYGPAIDSVFGMWRDREAVTDSVAWVRRQRDAWNNRLTHDED